MDKKTDKEISWEFVEINNRFSDKKITKPLSSIYVLYDHWQTDSQSKLHIGCSGQRDILFWYYYSLWFWKSSLYLKKQPRKSQYIVTDWRTDWQIVYYTVTSLLRNKFIKNIYLNVLAKPVFNLQYQLLIIRCMWCAVYGH